MLVRLRCGESAAAEDLTPLLYEQLRSLAGSMLADERDGHTLQPTALVHEAYIKLIDQRRVSEQDHSAFLRLAAMIMRRVLVDHARARHRLKRGGAAKRLTLLDVHAAWAETPASLDAERLDTALSNLESLDERKARLVELRFFCGLNEQAAADALGVSRATASREWRLARSWIQRELDRKELP
ncbi:MAG: ECF-type sigma factor [Planctomycetota bacterium]